MCFVFWKKLRTGCLSLVVFVVVVVANSTTLQTRLIIKKIGLSWCSVLVQDPEARNGLTDSIFR